MVTFILLHNKTKMADENIMERDSHSQPVSESEDSNLSSEDRIAWLRSKGILIELAEDRLKSKEEANKVVTGPCREILVVKIPCEDTEPYLEMNLSIPIDRNCDQLPLVLKRFFCTPSARLDENALQDAMKSQFSNQDIKISESTLELLGNEGSVETFPLTRPCENNDFLGVNFYLDEIGQIKQLQPNRRATAIANTCGFKNVPLVGDMYIGRVWNNPHSYEGFRNENFLVSDLNSNTKWMTAAEKDNFDFGIKTNKVAMDEGNSNGQTEKEVEDVLKGYKWSETLENIEVQYALPATVLTVSSVKKEVLVEFRSKSIRISMRKTKDLLLDVKLNKSISVDDCTWTCTSTVGNNDSTVSNVTLSLYLEKSSAGMWNTLE